MELYYFFSYVLRWEHIWGIEDWHRLSVSSISRREPDDCIILEQKAQRQKFVELTAEMTLLPRQRKIPSPVHAARLVNHDKREPGLFEEEEFHCTEMLCLVPVQQDALLLW